MSQTKMTRIKHKHDIEANWINSELIPMAGELIVYDADENNLYPRIKFGDGTHTANDLPFALGTNEVAEIDISEWDDYLDGLLKPGIYFAKKIDEDNEALYEIYVGLNSLQDVV